MTLDLFRPSPCPCGTGPALLEYPGEFRIMTWCLCETLVLLVADTLPEVLGMWEEVNGSFVAEPSALGEMG